ncbi:MAG: hypothetical protein K9N11_03025 [Lentisphaeria bacterium]|nr:hypothetical protein [Candidatus Neomarinimicrobiota bacterium]MCF7841805.1 hypothetical protein [Lentisphaeria bacterium]
MSGMQIRQFVVLWGILTLPLSAQFLMETHGYMGIVGHLHGFDKTNSENPGYRAEFLTQTDFFRFKSLYCGLLIGNRTIMISPNVGSEFRLDRIKYVLSPVLRYEFSDWILQTTFDHEAFHQISAVNEQGPIWLNAVQVSAGTKGSYYFYIRNEYQNISNRFLNKVDTYLTLGYFLRGKESMWIAKNHTYAALVSSRVRYHIGAFHRWAYWISVEYDLWQLQSHQYEDRITLKYNMFRKGLGKFVGFYYTYVVRDNYSLDNEGQLGALGVQIFF